MNTIVTARPVAARLGNGKKVHAAHIDNGTTSLYCSGTSAKQEVVLLDEPDTEVTCANCLKQIEAQNLADAERVTVSEEDVIDVPAVAEQADETPAEEVTEEPVVEVVKAKSNGNGKVRPTRVTPRIFAYIEDSPAWAAVEADPIKATDEIDADTVALILGLKTAEVRKDDSRAIRLTVATATALRGFAQDMVKDLADSTDIDGRSGRNAASALVKWLDKTTLA
jgi:hypothetical protein